MQKAAKSNVLLQSRGRAFGWGRGSPFPSDLAQTASAVLPTVLQVLVMSSALPAKPQQPRDCGDLLASGAQFSRAEIVGSLGAPDNVLTLSEAPKSHFGSEEKLRNSRWFYK